MHAYVCIFFNDVGVLTKEPKNFIRSIRMRYVYRYRWRLYVK